MKKVFLLATACFACFSAVYAQRLIHGIGSGTLADASSRTETKVTSTLAYSLRFSFAETENTSVSVGIPLSVGINGVDEYYYNSYTGNYSHNSLGFMVNVPLMVNFNIGAGAAEGCKKRMGFFAGGGFAYNISTVQKKFPSVYYDDEDYADPYYTASTVGPVGNVGVRITVGAKKRHNIEINASYMKGMTSHRPRIAGITCLFNF